MNSRKKGLLNKEVKFRLKKFGKNTIVKKKKFSRIGILFSQFSSPLVYILVIATLISLGLREYTDAAIIGIAVLEWIIWKKNNLV